ncbi:MAG: acyl carrier protein [Deltaproteobacteria bacterium]|nr:acyl carrier protein [Deltaproteobacteria bacterium]
MADKEQAAAVVQEIVARIAKREPGELGPDTRLAEDLGLKSVSRIELAALLEDRLGVEISNFDIRKPGTVGEVVALVQAKM